MPSLNIVLKSEPFWLLIYFFYQNKPYWQDNQPYGILPFVLKTQIFVQKINLYGFVSTTENFLKKWDTQSCSFFPIPTQIIEKFCTICNKRLIPCSTNYTVIAFFAFYEDNY